MLQLPAASGYLYKCIASSCATTITVLVGLYSRTTNTRATCINVPVEQSRTGTTLQVGMRQLYRYICSAVPVSMNLIQRYMPKRGLHLSKLGLVSIVRISLAYRYRGFRATYTMDSHCGPLCFSESGPTDSHCGLKLYCTVLRYCMVPVVRSTWIVQLY